MTRTSILSDIHVNATALRAVLAELEADEIDRAVGLGDVCHFDPSAAWAVVSVGSGRFSVELRRMPFDPEAVAAAHRASGMPYGEEYAGSWSA